MISITTTSRKNTPMINQNFFLQRRIPLPIVLKLMIYIMKFISIKVNLILVHILLKVFVVIPRTKISQKNERCDRWSRH